MAFCELNEAILDDVIGGAAGPAAPVATDTLTDHCPKCGMSITFNKRDFMLTCPNTRCRAKLTVKKGKLTL